MKTIAIALIQIYRFFLRPIFNEIVIFPSACRFTPTCSHYGLQAARQYGLLRGFMLSFRRVLRCRPGNAGGYDPLP